MQSEFYNLYESEKIYVKYKSPFFKKINVF